MEEDKRCSCSDERRSSIVEDEVIAKLLAVSGPGCYYCKLDALLDEDDLA